VQSIGPLSASVGVNTGQEWRLVACGDGCGDATDMGADTGDCGGEDDGDCRAVLVQQQLLQNHCGKYIISL
jgi:hypothetical protein